MRRLAGDDQKRVRRPAAGVGMENPRTVGRAHLDRQRRPAPGQPEMQHDPRAVRRDGGGQVVGRAEQDGQNQGPQMDATPGKTAALAREIGDEPSRRVGRRVRKGAEAGDEDAHRAVGPRRYFASAASCIFTILSGLLT